MSFSGRLRAELAQVIPAGKAERETAVAAILSNIGSIGAGEDGGPFLELPPGSPELMKKHFTLLRKTVKIDSGCFLPWLAGHPDGTIPEQMLRGGLGRVFLRELFLCIGFMNDPAKRYHLEFRCSSRPQADQACRALEAEGIRPHVTERKSYFVVYLKDSEDIETLLQLMGAAVCLMETVNARIYKGVRNTVNRRVNCETANIGKTVRSAGRQLADIGFLREKGILESLPEQLREAAGLREQFPDSPLSELGKLAVPPVGRSGMNHRFRRLAELAREHGRD